MGYAEDPETGEPPAYFGPIPVHWHAHGAPTYVWRGQWLAALSCLKLTHYRLRGGPQLGQLPMIAHRPKPAEERFPPHVLRAPHCILPLQLDEAGPRCHLTRAAHRHRPLGRGPQVAPQQLHRLCAPQRGRCVGAGNLQHHGGALPDERLRIVREPSRLRAARRGGEPPFPPLPLGRERWHDEEARDQPGRHTTSSNRRNAAAGSGAAVIDRPTTRWVAPRRTASSGVTVRT